MSTRRNSAAAACAAPAGGDPGVCAMPTAAAGSLAAGTIPRIGRAPGTCLPGTAVVPGRVVRLAVGRRPRQSCYIYVPHRLAQPARLFVTVHGISRNAREHAERFAPLAEEHGVVVVAPRFGRKGFAGYQRLAPSRSGQPADRVFDGIMTEVRDLLGLPDAPLFLFGFSGGGQFVHRYAMAHPGRVARAVVGAAGWYTFPDPDVRYPRGLGTSDRRPAGLGDTGFLRVPMAVVVGDRDRVRDDALNRSRRIDRHQGLDRFERGRRWIDAMREAARREGLATRYDFVALPAVGHDFTEAMTRGAMGRAVFDFLFGGRRTDAPRPTYLPLVVDLPGTASGSRP